MCDFLVGQGETCGGPYQYLAKHLQLGQVTDNGAELPESIELHNDFLRWLNNNFPVQDETAYQEGTHMQTISSDEEMGSVLPHCGLACIMLET